MERKMDERKEQTEKKSRNQPSGHPFRRLVVGRDLGDREFYTVSPGSFAYSRLKGGYPS
jgi:hypothetical protein